MVGAPSCIFMGAHVICFGTWTSNVNANRILWHIDERTNAVIASSRSTAPSASSLAKSNHFSMRRARAPGRS